MLPWSLGPEPRPQAPLHLLGSGVVTVACLSPNSEWSREQFWLRPPCPPPSPRCHPPARWGAPGQLSQPLTCAQAGLSSRVLFPHLSLSELKNTEGCEVTRRVTLCVFPDRPSQPTPTIRLNWALLLWEHLHQNAQQSLILAAFLVCAGTAEWVGGAIFQRGNIMSDPGFLKAILTLSEQWASKMIDLNEN